MGEAFPGNFKVTYLMEAIYSNGKVIDPSHPFYRDFVKFRDIVKEEDELEYIKQILPRWDRTCPKTYRVEVQLNDSVKKVLRSTSGWNPPTLLFHFVDSAINLSFPPSSGKH